MEWRRYTGGFTAVEESKKNMMQRYVYRRRLLMRASMISYFSTHKSLLIPTRKKSSRFWTSRNAQKALMTVFYAFAQLCVSARIWDFTNTHAFSF